MISTIVEIFGMSEKKIKQEKETMMTVWKGMCASERVWIGTTK